MSIKPVDFQVMLPKTSEVSKIPNAEQQKQHVLQQHQVSTIQQKSEETIRQVHSQDKASEAKIRERQEKGQQKNQDGKKKNKSLYGTNKKKCSDISSSTIDIRL